MRIEDVFATLTRAGPGEADDVVRVMASANPPDQARILDAGAGIGADLPALRAARPNARITAVDLSQPFVARLRFGFPDLRVARCDMTTPPDPPYDLIWSAGAAYGAGINRALTAWRGMLAPQGAVAFSHLLWRVDNPSLAARSFWASEGLEIEHLPAHLARVEHAGYRLIGHFWLSDQAWANYYMPLEQALSALPKNEITQAFRQEIALWRDYGTDFGYLMAVLVPHDA